MPFRQPVSSYMSTDLVVVTSDTLLSAVARLLDDQRISALPVADDDGTFAGVISRTDLLHAGRIEPGRHRGQHVLVVPELRVAALVTHTPLVCTPETSLRDAARQMVAARVHRLFVVAGGRAVGVITTLDLTAAVRDARVQLPLSEVTRGPVTTVRASATVATAAAALAQGSTDVVVMRDQWPIGVFTPLDALVARDLPPTTAVEDACERAILCLPARTFLHDAAAQAAALAVWRVVAFVGPEITGVASGLDLARLVAA